MTVAVWVCLAAMIGGADSEPIRFATFNSSLHFTRAGELVDALGGGENEHARRIAAIIQAVRPDVLLINEFDYDADGRGAEMFVAEYLAKSQFGQPPVAYEYRFLAPVNTGVQTGQDLDGDGTVGGGNDAHGFGRYAGQFGMLVLSRLPIDIERVRTFRHFRWAAMPEPRWPRTDAGEHYYSAAARGVLRLSSKSHWDVPVVTASGVTIHLLASHPTPPVFDGPEDRNGARNHDEIRFWSDYVGGADYPIDDAGQHGGLVPGAHFVVVGDQNADPLDGDSVDRAILQLLDHPRIQDPRPRSDGGIWKSKQDGGVNLEQRGDPALDTADFGDDGPGNLRIDYVLPDRGLEVVDAGVFWPVEGELGSDWIGASDHRLVWVDLHPPSGEAAQEAFFERLCALDGARFEGLAVYPEEPGEAFADKILKATFSSCTDDRIAIPFVVGNDRSRTWIIRRAVGGLELKHDHRHDDGMPDEITMYGGTTAKPGTKISQSFPADAHTAELIPEAATNEWFLTLSEDGRTLTYYLERHGQPRFKAVLNRVR